MKVIPMRRTLGPYEATSTSPRVADWTRNGYGPNATLDDIDVARARSQDAVRNNPWLRNALDLLVSHQIGCGIQPRPKIADAGLRKALLQLWNDWCAEADADGVNDFYAWQNLVARSVVESGEVFIRLRPRRPSDGLRVPLQVQALEADLLPVRHNRTSAPKIRQGIELNAWGQRVAYWFYREHPGDHYAVASLGNLSRVPAAEIIHHYTPKRPGQLRGEPDTISALLRGRNIDHYESAELTRKKIRAKFVGAIYRENPDDGQPPIPMGGLAQASEDDLRRIQSENEQRDLTRGFYPVDDGALLDLNPTERMELYKGDSGDASLLDFLRTQMRGIAAALGVPYELMTGDYEGTNDRIMRVILNTFYRRLEIRQDHLAAQVLQPIWNAWLQTVFLTNTLRLPGYQDDPRAWQRCEWRPQAWSYVNPLQEAQTAALKIKNGLTSRSAVVAESGWDAEDIDQQQADDHEREHALGLDYGGDAGNDASLKEPPDTVEKPT